MSSRDNLTFYWHDYETFGADPRRDRPAQFAGIRTDADFNVIGDPLVLFCRPANDFLPQPAACLVTGITPQKAREQGVPEAQFIARIHAELARPGTCAVGYNSLRFDDEVTRNTLYRNFYDPYAREWQNGNSRWDIIDMLRTACALRPEGIHWPEREDGYTSFRLEDLTAANGIGHEGAHDALADVYATIEMAKLVRDKQPKLFAYLLTHRDKHAALAQLDVDAMKPVLHVSGMFGAARNNIALIVPLARHPSNRNEVICWDLMADPAVVETLSAQELRELLYTPTDQLPEGAQRPGFKSIHINRCPVILPAKMADRETAVRLGIAADRCRAHLAALRSMRSSDAPAFTAKVQAVAGERELQQPTDPDLMLYSGGFFSDKDRQTMESVRETAVENLSESSFAFEDGRLQEMLFRYRARNYPETLADEERELWNEYRYERITEPAGGASIAMQAFQHEIEHRMADPGLSAVHAEILTELLDYADELLA